MGKISELDPAAPLTGIETIPVVQGGEAKRASLSYITDLAEAAAQSHAEAAEASAAAAEAFTGPTYANTAAGLAATSDGDSFAVVSGGIVTVYLNDGGSAVALRNYPTADALSGIGGAALIGTASGGTVQEALDALEVSFDAEVLAAETARDEAEAAADLAGQYGDMKVYRTWALLNAVTGTAGDMATVLTDTGTHTDPVVGGTVSNSGIFAWVASPAGWERIGNTTAADAAESADAAEASAANMAEIVNAISDGSVATYVGTGPVYPLLTDAAGAVLIGYDSAAEEVVGQGMVTDSRAAVVVDDQLAALGQNRFIGTTGIAPILTDSRGSVLLGYDINRRRVVGDGLSNQQARSPDQALANPPAAKGLNHILFYGQSLSVGANSGALVSTTQPYSNVTFQGGPRAWTGTSASYAPLKPLVEDAINPAPDTGTNRGETPCSGAASYASTLAAIEHGIAPADHVILASTAGRGGWRIDQLEKGQDWYNDWLLEHTRRAKLINANYACHAVAWCQGEADGLASTSYATYLAKLTQMAVDMDADIRAISGQTTPVYLLTYQVAGMAATWGEVQRAQLDAARTSDLIHMVCPIYHLPMADNLHLTSAGYRWLGAYFGRAYSRMVHGGVAPRCLMPLSAIRRGNQVRVRFDVPVRPLVLDEVRLNKTLDWGFRVVDTVGTVAIAAVHIEDDDVVLTLSSTPVGATNVRYAMDYMSAGVAIQNGATGNLRDNAPETVTIGGVVRNLYNWSPHFTLPVTVIGE